LAFLGSHAPDHLDLHLKQEVNEPKDLSPHTAEWNSAAVLATPFRFRERSCRRIESVFNRLKDIAAIATLYHRPARNKFAVGVRCSRALTQLCYAPARDFLRAPQECGTLSSCKGAGLRYRHTMLRATWDVEKGDR
jgi:hypothetical protein